MIGARLRSVVTFITLVVIAGCQQLPADEKARDALLVVPDAACRGAIAAAVAGLVGGPAMLAEDAFVRSPTLTIERRRMRDPSTGRMLDGLDAGVPSVMRLVIHGGVCEVHGGDHRQVRTLQSCRCRAAFPD